MVRMRLALFLPLAIGSLAACSDAGESDADGLNCPRGRIERDGACVLDDRRDTRDDDRDTSAPDSGGEGPDAGDDSTATPDLGGDAGDTSTQPGDSGPTPECVGIAVQCSAAGVPQVCTDGRWTDSVPCGPTERCQLGSCVPGVGCTPGETLGCSSDTELLTCNDTGADYLPAACPESQPWCLSGRCGTQVCEAGMKRCKDGYTIESCGPDGTFYVESSTCDRLQGEVCNLGECVSGCIAATKDPTYVGCEYWSVFLPQYNDPTVATRSPHSVVLANASNRTANITVQAFNPTAGSPSPISVPAGQTGTLTFVARNRANEINGTSKTNRSFKVMTDQPVVAYQFNPLNNVGVYSNDASLLLPAHALGSDYMVMTMPGGVDPGFIGNGPQASFFTVVAVAGGTTNVDITFTADVRNPNPADPLLANIRKGQTKSFALAQGDVLNFEFETKLAFPAVPGDPTGSRIRSDRPIAVFAGHQQAVLGEPSVGPDGQESSCCADHLEQQLFPLRVWGRKYLAVHSPPRGSEKDIWRVLASTSPTLITTNPPIPDLNGARLNAGEFIEISTTESFELEASAPVLVGQFIVSQQADGIAQTKGDPAFVLAVPVEQFRTDYVFLTPNGYDEDYVTIVKPGTSPVFLDGTQVDESRFAPFGAGTFRYANIPLEPGSHRVNSPANFAISLWGYDNAVSYGVPGGLNLTPAPP